MNFRDIGIKEELVTRLAEEGIDCPTAIQEAAIPKILRGDNLIVRSQTGSGKSLTYLLPMIQKIAACGDDSTLMILVPTRELALQVGGVCNLYATTMNLESVVVYGGVDYAIQIEALAKKPNIVIATPGRLEDLIERGDAQLTALKFFILDEMDVMIDLNFRDPIMRLAKLRCESAQTLLFSATTNSRVEEVLSELCGEIEEVVCSNRIATAEGITQSGYYVEQSVMEHRLLHLLRKERVERSIVFCRSRKMADRLTSILKESNFSAEAIHSERSQAAREHILSRFSSGESSILVATDLMSRGIDVENITHIFNFGLPQNPEDYIHRVGRTGRAGRSGVAISLICPDEKPMLDAICKMMKQNIPISTTHPYFTTAALKAIDNKLNIDKKKRRRK